MAATMFRLIGRNVILAVRTSRMGCDGCLDVVPTGSTTPVSLA